MSRDISEILRKWEHDPDDVNVRVVRGDDGRELIQLRLDLGVLQMEIDGRPDGRKIFGCDSWLDHLVQRQQESKGDDFELTPEDCQQLLREGIQYYHRYLSFWHLERYELCARDTNRNLRLLAFVRRHASTRAEKLQFDQWRPYLTMMHTRSVATPILEAGDLPGAIEVIDRGIRDIESFLVEYEHEHRAENCAELGQLKTWHQELLNRASKKSVDATSIKLNRLRNELDEAVLQERYEEAARLRDEIRSLS